MGGTLSGSRSEEPSSGRRACIFVVNGRGMGAEHPAFPAGYMMHVITQPRLMEEKPHAHDCDQREQQ